MIHWKYIVLHHSLTKDGTTVSTQAIRRYHKVDKGYLDVSYHYLIELVNNEYEIFVGRPLNMSGAHCTHAGMNTIGIGVCIVGNFDAHVPIDKAWNKAVTLCRTLMDVFNIPVENVIGHREAGKLEGFDWQKGEYKSCPGKLFSMDGFRENI